MMKKWFIAIFIICLIIILIYQNKYLDSLKNEASQLSQQATDPSKTIVGKGMRFKTFFYDKNGHLNAEMSGDEITYYEDGTFKANGHLLYKTFDESDRLTNTIKTTSALGVFEQDSDTAFVLSGSRQLKSLELPDDVLFNFNGNEGQTKNVFIDAIDRTISSNEHIQSEGPDGKFSADGFSYDIDTKDFTFNSKVRGLYKKQKSKQEHKK